jgi:surface polysaccharide O-acyltransferase-like enzyme
MNPYLSNKITFFSFWLIVLVVLLHSLNVTFTNCDNLICGFQYFLSHKLTQIAVPLFFFISGYLYFLKADVNKNIDFSFFVASFKKRLKTILLPYVLWCVLWFLFMYGIQFLPVIKNYFSEPLHNMILKDKILNLFYYPLNYPLWFLRELIVLFLITPILFFFIKYLKILVVFALLLLALIYNKVIVLYGLVFLQSIPLFFFSMGAFFSMYKKNIIIIKPKRYIAFGLLTIWFFLNIVSLYDDKQYFFSDSSIRGLDLVKNLLGCFTIWYLYDFFNKKNQWKNYSYYKYSFFIFTFHGIPTVVLIKISSILTQENPYYLFLAYLNIFILVIVTAICIAKIINKLYPKTYKILTGSR